MHEAPAEQSPPRAAACGSLSTMVSFLRTAGTLERTAEALGVSTQAAPRVHRKLRSGSRLLPLPGLRAILEPAPRERMLELRPQSAYYASRVARWTRGGRLDLVHQEPEHLEATLRGTRESGAANAVATLAPVDELPFPDDTFDGAYALAALDRGTERDGALRELRRVLKPEGRVVLAELFWTRNWLSYGALLKRTSSAGLSFERRLGGPLGYYARFCPAARVVPELTLARRQ